SVSIVILYTTVNPCMFWIQGVYHWVIMIIYLIFWSFPSKQYFIFTSHLYNIIPLIASLTLTPLLVKNPKKVSLWIILALLWFSFLKIIIYTILVVLRIVPA